MPVSKANLGNDYTLEGWFLWMSGDGPLMATATPGELEFIYDDEGRCAYRVGGVERTTPVPVQSVTDHWIYVVVAKAGTDVILRLNEGVADRWNEAPAQNGLSDMVAMKDAVGFAADIACYSRRLSDDDLDVHWHAGKARV
jgi:hypothetical protein